MSSSGAAPRRTEISDTVRQQFLLSNELELEELGMGSLFSGFAEVGGEALAPRRWTTASSPPGAAGAGPSPPAGGRGDGPSGPSRGQIMVEDRPDLLSLEFWGLNVSYATDLGSSSFPACLKVGPSPSRSPLSTKTHHVSTPPPRLTPNSLEAPPKTTQKEILHDCFGLLRPGQLTALMGPSGAAAAIATASMAQLSDSAEVARGVVPETTLSWGLAFAEFLSGVKWSTAFNMAAVAFLVGVLVEYGFSPGTSRRGQPLVTSILKIRAQRAKERVWDRRRCQIGRRLVGP